MKKFKLELISYVMILCMLAVAVLFTQNMKLVEASAQNFNKSLRLIDLEEWNTLLSSTEKRKNEKALFIYENENEDSIKTCNNVKYVLDTIGVDITIKKIDEQPKYSTLSNYDTLILCLSDLESLLYTKNEMEAWVKSGKGIFFTMPMENNTKLSEFSDLLGIADKNNISTIEFKHMMIMDDFLISGKEEVFDEVIINGDGLKVELTDEVNLHVATDDDNNDPIVWNLQFGDGYVSVCNANLLQNKISRGIIISCYAELHDNYIYPVINASMYCIDDFPAPISTGYHEEIYKEYGCNIEDFYFNIWWPKIKQLSQKYGIKYSGYVIQTYEDIVEPPYNNTTYMKTSKYYANSLLSVGGEIGIHGYNHQSFFLIDSEYIPEELNYVEWKNIDHVSEAMRSVIAYAKKLAPNAEIASYVAPSNVIDSKVKALLENEIKDIRIYAGLYEVAEEDEKVVMLQEFEVKENGTIHVPRMASDMNILDNDQNRFVLLNELSYQYIQCMFFHPDDILDPERSYGHKFSYLYEQFEKLVKLLNNLKIRNTTVSEGGAALQRYELTSYERQEDGNKINFKIEGLQDEVYYMLRINNDQTIKNIEGAEIQKINDTYYLLKIMQKDVVIEME